MGLKHPKINFHWRQKISVGWARCSWTWRKISALSEIGVHWNSIYDLKGTVSMSVSPRANSYTSRLQRVCSKRPKGTHMSPSSTYLYFLQFKRYHIRGYMTLPIHCCSLSCLHIGSGFESLLCRCLVSSLRILPKDIHAWFVGQIGDQKKVFYRTQSSPGKTEYTLWFSGFSFSNQLYHQ